MTLLQRQAKIWPFNCQLVVKVSPVFPAKPKDQKLEHLCFNQGILNDRIKNQWELSVLEKANSEKYELMWTLFGKLVVLERFLHKTFRILNCNRSQASGLCSILGDVHYNFVIKILHMILMAGPSGRAV